MRTHVSQSKVMFCVCARARVCNTHTSTYNNTLFYFYIVGIAPYLFSSSSRFCVCACVLTLTFLRNLYLHPHPVLVLAQRHRLETYEIVQFIVRFSTARTRDFLSRSPSHSLVSFITLRPQTHAHRSHQVILQQ